jgi:hypothetical protein
MYVMKIFTCFLLALITMTAFAADTVKVKPKGDISPSSLSVEYTRNTFTIAFVNDGFNSFAGIALDTKLSVGNKFALNVLTITDRLKSETVYTGLYGTYKIYDGVGLSASIGAGFKGFDWSSQTFPSQRQFIFGFQVSGAF